VTQRRCLSIGDSSRGVVRALLMTFELTRPGHCRDRTGAMPCDSMASEPGGGDLWGLLAERLECTRERPLGCYILGLYRIQPIDPKATFVI